MKYFLGILFISHSIFAFDEKVSVYGVVKPTAITTVIAINNGIVTKIITPLGGKIDLHGNLIEVLEKETSRIYRSSLSGQVAKLHVTEGAVVTTGMPLATVLNPEKKELEVSLSPQDAAQVRVGTEVINRSSGETFGKVSRVSPLVDPDSGAVMAFVTSSAKVNFLIGDVVPLDLLIKKSDNCKVVTLAESSRYKNDFNVKSIQDGKVCLHRKPASEPNKK
ncbi:MAG: HlyD family efflux transporter periplasmic adaptor subunit [Pseudobdellovibrionaceae bacterium]